ncbi:MAG: alpha-mannosidase [Verrucomicrobia bacterium]|nr:alpha-mannosidase [Verrucomicrobiota bacterium]
MLPLNPLIQLTPLRAQRGVLRLTEMIWHDARLLRIEATASRPDHIALAVARKLPRRAVRDGDVWGRLYDQRWSRVVIPAGAPRWMRWDEQGEATLFINGTPFYGFDVAHRTCELPAGTHEVWVESLCAQAAIWHPDARGLAPGGNLFRGAQLLRRDDEAWAAYHDLNCLYDWMLEMRQREHPGIARELNAMSQQPPLIDVSPVYRRLLRGLDTALDGFDTGGIPALRRGLAAIYREMRDSQPFSRAALTGHSHLDLVWLWTEQFGEGKAVHTFANVNRLMALYPEFRFAYSQPASYEAVGRRSPELHRAVRARIRTGQWEATGGMYVESDSHVACGEGLARSFMLGQESFEKLTGRRSRSLWLPDLFGFTACLPQLMRLSGVDYFFTTKTTWNTLNRFPHSSFVWRGAGGHGVVSHVTQGVQFNNTMSVDQLRSAAHQHQQGDLHDEFLMPNGYGDGGGGPSEEMCERARRLSALRGLPALKWDQPEAFFDRLARKTAQLPVLDGEIYLEYHRGTFTTHSRVKSRFRELERALQLREAALVATHGAATADLAHAWRRMVFAQFHDYIPGSSIPEVYATGLPELAGLARGQAAAAVQALAKGPSRASGDALHLFNPLPIARRCLVQGKVYDLPPLAGVPAANAQVTGIAPVTVEHRRLSNRRVEAKIDARGHLSSLSVDGRFVELAANAGELVVYPEQPANFGPWDIDRASLSLGQPARGPATITTEKNAIAVARKIGASSTSVVRYWLEPGSTLLRVTVELDWHEPEVMVKLHFPTTYRGREVRCGTPFGSILRPQLATTREAEAMWEWPISRWATVSAETEREGLFLVTEAKYGVSCRDGNLGLTLIRTQKHVGFEDHGRAYPAQLSRLPKAGSIFTDLGPHRIELALGFYDVTAPRAEQPVVHAENLFTPAIAYRGKPVASAFRGIEGGESLIPHWAKPEGRNRWVLRLHEVSGQRGVAKVQLDPGWSARKIDLLGKAMGTPLRGGRLPFDPYEIVSLEMSRKA